MKGVAVISVCNNFIKNKYKPVYSNIYRVSQSINENIFKPIKKDLNKNINLFKIGWSGDYSNPIKNFNKILSVCNMPEVSFLKTKNLNREELNVWYNNLDATICGSQSEGGPLLLLEAGAVGLPILTANVGLAREIISHKKNGYIININNKELVQSYIQELIERKDFRIEIGKNLQNEILKNWTYKTRLYEIKNVFKLF